MKDINDLAYKCKEWFISNGYKYRYGRNGIGEFFCEIPSQDLSTTLVEIGYTEAEAVLKMVIKLIQIKKDKGITI